MNPPAPALHAPYAASAIVSLILGIASIPAVAALGLLIPLPIAATITGIYALRVTHRRGLRGHTAGIDAIPRIRETMADAFLMHFAVLLLAAIGNKL